MRLPEINFINPWLLGEECKPIIIRDADKALHFVSPRQLNDYFVKSVGLILMHIFCTLHSIEIVNYLSLTPFTGRLSTDRGLARPLCGGPDTLNRFLVNGRGLTLNLHFP